MFYKKFENYIVVRIEKNEELVSTLKKFCEKEKILAGTILSCIGAANKIEIGIFNTETKSYNSTIRTGDHEITSVSGNITTMNEQVYLHLHATVADESLSIFGGHLNSAIVSATCEIVLAPITERIERFFDKESGLNLIKLSSREK